MSGRGPTDAVTLADLVGAVDWAERVIPTAEELNEAIAALAAASEIEELPGHRYFGNGAVTGTKPTPITEQEVSVAAAEHSRFVLAAQERLERDGEDPDLPTWGKLICRIPPRHGHYPDEAEVDQDWAVMGEVLAALQAAGFQAISVGASVGPDGFQCPVMAAKGDDASAMLTVARPAFATAAPQGSTIEIGGWGGDPGK